MIPIHIRISGFLSYRDPVEVDFTRFDLACISGHNGAGKSSLLDAITWALFGQARKRDDSLINLQSKTAEVMFTFEYEDNVYRVIRALPRGKTTTLEFQILDDEAGTTKPGASPVPQGKWRPLTERTLRETQARLEQILHLDYETFVNAAFFLQGKADQFAQQTASKRKDVLSSILGLEMWEIYKGRVSERRRELEDDIRSIDGRVAEIDAELSEEELRRARLDELEAELGLLGAARRAQETLLEELKKTAASLDQQVTEEKARLEEERRGLERQEQAVSDQASTLDQTGVQLATAKKSLAETEERILARGKIEEERNEADKTRTALEIENGLLRANMDELKKRMDQLRAAEGAVCPLCGQPLSAGHRKATLKQLQEEGKEQADRFRANKTLMDDLAKQIADCESQIAKLRNAERERLNHSSSIAQLTERTEAIRTQVKDWETAGKRRLKEIKKILEGGKYALDTHGKLPDLDGAERALFDLQEQENHLTLEVGAARQKVSVLGDLRKRKVDLESARGTLAQQIARHKTLERAFGKDGVPALLIEQSLPQIETKANELLDRLSDGQMSIRFVTQAEYKDRKRDDLKETLDIQISDAAGPRDYEMYSGGEAFRVNFAIRLALSEVLARRKGARLQTLVIDEGFGSQDVRGRQRLIEAINLVKNDFAKILVVTHLDELKDAFPTRIEVEKTERGSTINVI
jgi:DNA repair protein SbcC/Rad50